MNTLLRILFISLWLFSAPAYSDVKQPRVILLHINGVNTSPEEADRNRLTLEQTSTIKSNISIWDTIYNSSHGLLASDLWDVMRMKKQEAKNLSVDDYVQTYMKTYHLNYPINSPEYKKLKDDIKQNYLNDPSIVGKNLKEIIDQFHAKVPPPYTAVLELLKHYNSLTGTNNAYVLLIPHSQGNQYANQLWDFLVNYEHFPQSHLAIFGLASPTDKTLGIVRPANQDNYYTADNDFVINSLGILSPLIPETNKPMTGNMHLYTCKDIICHNLVDSYLEDPEAKYRINNRISSFLIALKKNLIEEQLGKNINALFWMDEQFARVSILRNNRKVICANGMCDDTVNYLETDLPQLDSYKGYRWSSSFLSDAYGLFVPFHLYNSFTNANPNDYFFIRGNIIKAVDFSSANCLFNPRDRQAIDNVPTSPFYGKSFAGIATVLGGCPIPDRMTADNKTKVTLGQFLLQ